MIVTNCTTKETNQLTRSRVLGGSEQLVKSRVDHIGDIAQVQLLHKQKNFIFHKKINNYQYTK
jgi:hypothetical protein